MSSFVPVYRQTGSPLHRARPAVAAAFALCPAAVALAFDHPLTGARVEASSPLPDDLAAALEQARG